MQRALECFCIFIEQVGDFRTVDGVVAMLEREGRGAELLSGVAAAGGCC